MFVEFKTASDTGARVLVNTDQIIYVRQSVCNELQTDVILRDVGITRVDEEYDDILRDVMPTNRLSEI